MAVTEITTATFPDEVLLAEVPVVVDYWADWCAPCKQIAPILEELSDDYEGRVKFVKVDTTEHPDLAQEQMVMSLPTLQFFTEGRVAKQFSGARSKKDLQKVIEELL